MATKEELKKENQQLLEFLEELSNEMLTLLSEQKHADVRQECLLMKIKKYIKKERGGKY